MESIGSRYHLPVGRIAGIRIRLHWIFPLWLAIELYVSVVNHAVPFSRAAGFLAAFFACVLAHELGHCFTARRRGLSADEIILWPLGGVAHIGGGGGARTELLVAAAGPAVNLALAAAFVSAHLAAGGEAGANLLDPFRGWYETVWLDLAKANLILGLFNLLVPAYPLDGGRILLALLRPRLGWERAVLSATSIGIGIGVGAGVWAVLVNEVMLVLIAIFVVFGSWQTRRALREGALEGPQEFLGHDFSFGHTTLGDLDEERRRPGWIARWRENRRAAADAEREAERAANRSRVDALLEKISREGVGSLTAEEKSFLDRASRRYSERHPEV